MSAQKVFIDISTKRKIIIYAICFPAKKPYRSFKKARKASNKSQLSFRNIVFRTENANSRNTLGHWEGDTIHFPVGQKSCVTTLVERKSRFVCLRKNKNKTASTVIGGIYNIIKSSPLKIWDSLTFDRGPEFMEYPQLEQKTKCKIYFCDPRAPWQRGSNENTNGRLRRYLPKKHSIDETSQEDLDRIAILVNNTPRKCLGYETPREVFIQVWKTFCRAAL
jgi:IS30 family transposase